MTLTGFFIGKYELTQGQWRRVIGNNPSAHGPELPHEKITLANPVESVTYADAQRFLRRLDLDLPTEALWEYACRGGTTTPWWTGVDRESLRGSVNVADGHAQRMKAPWPRSYFWLGLDDGHVLHAPVGSYRANPFGLHEMIGNVEELRRDRWMPNYAAPVRPGDGLRMVSWAPTWVVRGGEYSSPVTHCRSSARNERLPAGQQDVALGFRVARKVH